MPEHSPVILRRDELGESFGRDYAASIHPDVKEYYGAKINTFFSAREFRVAFGHAYPHIVDGEPAIEPRYEVAIFMPIQTVRELVIQMQSALKAIEAAANEADEEDEAEESATNGDGS